MHEQHNYKPLSGGGGMQYGPLTVSCAWLSVRLTLILPRRSVWSIPHNDGT